MSSGCAKLDFKDADILLGKSNSIPKNGCDGSVHRSVDGLEDAPESDGDDSGNIGNTGDAPQSDGDDTGSEDAPESDGDDTGNTGNTGYEDSRESDVDDTGNTGNIGSQYVLQTSDFSPRSSDEGEEDFEIALRRSEPAQETPAMLISAMKGGREKNGLSPSNLSVKWAADVYDPLPSIVSHTRNKKQQKSKGKDKENHKKNGKKGQKAGNSSRGGKDKKQSRKNGRNADAYCGGGFFKTNLTKVHYSVAEAL